MSLFEVAEWLKTTTIATWIHESLHGFPAAYGNVHFRIKSAALLLAGVNAFLCHFMTERQIARWNEAGDLNDTSPGQRGHRHRRSATPW